MSLVYTRTIKTPAGPVLLEVEDLPGRYTVEYRYSFKDVDGSVLHHATAIAREQIAYYGPDIIQHAEREALAALGRALFQEV